MKYYAYNFLDSNLVIRGGYFTLKSKAWTPVDDYSVKTGVFEQEVALGRVKLEQFSVDPDDVALEEKRDFSKLGSTTTLGKPDPNDGMNEEQLKAMLAGKADVKNEDNGMTADELKAMLNAKKEQTPEVVPEVEKTAPAKKTSKAKTEKAE